MIRPLSLAHHRHLRVDRARAAAGRGLVQVGLSELALAAADMPLCLAKDAGTGRFNLVALMSLPTAGAETGNLFVAGANFRATYMPYGALLAAFRLDSAGVAGLAVDERALGGEGEALFDGDAPGANLVNIRAALERLVTDVAAAQALVDDYAQRRLIRPLRLVLRHADGTEHALDGLYTPDSEAIQALDDAAVLALHRADRLAPAAVMAASLAQLERLRQLHDATRTHPIAAIRVGE